MKRPTISVLIPVHNEEKYIGRCLRSILNQTLSRDEYEVIVINDASDDKTSYAVNLFGEDVQIIHNNEKVGLPGSLNKGVKKARGEYIIRLDGDDYVSSEYLNVLALFLKHNKDMDAVACDYLMVDDEENVMERRDCMEHPLGCGIMFRVDQLLDVGLYDDKFLMHEDRDLRIRFLKKYKIHRIALPLYRYRQHAENMTKNTQAWKEYEEKIKDKHQGGF